MQHERLGKCDAHHPLPSASQMSRGFATKGRFSCDFSMKGIFKNIFQNQIRTPFYPPDFFQVKLVFFSKDLEQIRGWERRFLLMTYFSYFKQATLCVFFLFSPHTVQQGSEPLTLVCKHHIFYKLFGVSV